MSLVGKSVKVIGTSRADLNGRCGLAQIFNDETGRYTVLLESGDMAGFKPVNLELRGGPTTSTSTTATDSSQTTNQHDSPNFLTRATDWVMRTSNDLYVWWSMLDQNTKYIWMGTAAVILVWLLFSTRSSPHVYESSDSYSYRGHTPGNRPPASQGRQDSAAQHRSSSHDTGYSGNSYDTYSDSSYDANHRSSGGHNSYGHRGHSHIHGSRHGGHDSGYSSHYGNSHGGYGTSSYGTSSYGTSSYGSSSYGSGSGIMGMLVVGAIIYYGHQQGWSWWNIMMAVNMAQSFLGGGRRRRGFGGMMGGGMF